MLFVVVVYHDFDRPVLGKDASKGHRGHVPGDEP